MPVSVASCDEENIGSVYVTAKTCTLCATFSIQTTMEGLKGKGALQQQPKCRVCAQNESLYACPKCNCRYCSSKCYRLHGDGTCVEAFHAESLARMMKNEKHFDGDSEDEEEKKREMEAMVMEYERHMEKDEREMRTRFGLEAKSFSPSSSDDDEEDQEEEEEDDTALYPRNSCART